MQADSHASHGSAVADPHGHATHDAHGHDAGHDPGHDPHGGHGQHDEAASRTPVPAFEKTPWGLILGGIVVAAVVVAWGLSRNWAGHLKSNPASTIPPAGQSAK